MKKSKRYASPIRMPKAPSKSPIIKRRSKKFNLKSIFQRKQTKNIRRGRKGNIGMYLFIPAVFLMITSVIYFSIKYVLFLRENAYGEREYAIGKVVGLDNVPTIGGSHFLFEDDMDDPTVKEFLSNGNSVYKLTKEMSTKEIEEYYLKTLEPLGWEYVQSIPIGTPDKKYGQYWIKDSKGLRIYTKYQDVWYESITQEDARSALSRLVQEEIEREMLMATTEKQTLLPDYPWRIEIPKEYLIKYSPTQLKELRAVSFQKLGSTEIIEMYPIGKWREKDLDSFLHEYCSIKSTQESKCGVLNSIPISFRGTLGLKSTLQFDASNLTAYTVVNTFNSTVYVITSTEEQSPLLGYILENMKPMSAKE